MLIGGFQNIDLDLLQKEPTNDKLPIACDMDGVFQRSIYTNNGRTAAIHMLTHWLDCRGGVVLLPDYLCLSVVVSIEHPGPRCRYYKVNRNLEIDLDDLKSKIDDDVRCIYIIHYFGVPQSAACARELQAIRAQQGIPIVEDITQALFSRDRERMGYGDFLLASTRKWMPMTDGGVLAVRNTNGKEAPPLPEGYNEIAYTQLLISLQRDYFAKHPKKDMDYYLQLEARANKTRYEDLTVCQMTEASRRIMLNCDYEELTRRRIANYNYLYGRLAGNPNLTILSKKLDANGGFVPFGLVVLVEERDAFYRYLAAEHRIVGEIQWLLPLECYSPGEDARYLSDHNLMLHCDQRYTQAEMERVAQAVEAFFAGGAKSKRPL